ncbi:MAG: hypothetical protein JO297_01370 [Nitrososphaeraceae archaeon]|nr:hypothetical protein [Nitrososphaeraceae archaeon]
MLLQRSYQDTTKKDNHDQQYVSNNDLKSLFACQSKAAKIGPVNQAEVDNCYNQIFPQGQGEQTPPQQTAVQQLVQLMREGFPFK